MVLKSFYLPFIAGLLIALPLYITPVSAQSCPHDGDVNQNGSLTPADTLLAFRHFLGLAEPPLDTCQQAHANVEDPENSGITPADALCIFRKFLGFLSCLDPLPAVVSDRDGDGIPDPDDDFPDDPAEFRDNDRNGTGNFAQLDEDGDLYPDTEDEFPFAPNKNTYPTFTEVEPNDVPFLSLANMFGPYPLRITGTFETGDWTDSFAFSAKQGDVISVALRKTEPEFNPILSILSPTLEPVLQTGGGNYSKNSPFSAMTSALISLDGTYSVMVEDAYGKGGATFDYTLEIFRDRDMDGLADDRELALGINPDSPDSDKDGIYDAAEIVGNPDFDGDGVPNWFDKDSDDDGIPDGMEGSGDADADGRPNFVDTDADGNGVPDSEEAGPDPSWSENTDFDDLADFLDTDDDNDYLLDLHDPDRLEPVAWSDIADMQDRLFVQSAYVNVGGNNLPEGVVRPGDQLVLKGEGFSSTASENVVIFLGTQGAANVTPISARSDQLVVVVPSPAGSRVSVVRDNRQSNWFDLIVLDADDPVVLQPFPPSGSSGDILTLSGLNFSGNMTVSFGGSVWSATVVDSETLEVFIPFDAESGDLWVESARGRSNSVDFKVTHNVLAWLTMPAGSDLDVTSLIVSYDLLAEQNPDAFGVVANAKVDRSAMDVIHVLVPESSGKPAAVYLQAVTLPDDLIVTVDTLSSAVALTMQAMGIESRIREVDSLAKARDLIAKLPEVATLEAALKRELVRDPYFLNQPPQSPPDFYQKWLEAAQAAHEEIDSKLADGTLKALRQGQSTLRQRNNVMPYQKQELEPTITSEQYNIKVYRVGGTSNVGVENDTLLYLSAAIYELSTRKALYSHISGYFDPNMIGPQGLGVLGWASEKEDFNQPRGRNCRVAIVTPGVSPPRYEAIRVPRYLFARTFVDQVLLPGVTLILGQAIQNEVAGIILSNAGNAMNGVGTAIAAGDARLAAKAIVQAIWDDMRSVPPGPITTALAKRLGKHLAGEALEHLAKKIGMKLTPFLGLVSLAVDYVGVQTTIENVRQTLLELSITPGVLYFTVTWPLEVTDVWPDIYVRKRGELSFRLEGKRFTPIKKGIWPFESTLLPEVLFTDEGGRAAPVMLTPYVIAPNGNEMAVMMPAWFRGSAQGPIRVDVLHDDGALGVEWPRRIKVTSELKISKLIPDHGGPGMPMLITGSGFAPNALMNTVTFPIASWKGTSGVVQAMVQEATESYLKVVVPEFAGSGDVHVEANGQVSNSLAFSVDDLGECVYWREEEDPFCIHWRCTEHDSERRFCLNLQR